MKAELASAQRTTSSTRARIKVQDDLIVAQICA